MQIEVFKVFSDLANCASFSKTAEMNGVTQSAVSQQIRSIEKKYGVMLVERSRKNFSLTPEGQVFLEAARQILQILDDIGNQIQEIKDTIGGNLRVSTIFSIGLHDIPECIKQFRQKYPTVDVRVEYKRSSEVYNAVIEGRADVGLVAYPSERRGISALTFLKDRLKLICGANHPFAKRKSISPSELEGVRFIAFEPDLPTRREIDAFLNKANIKVKTILEFDNIETVKKAVEVEDAVSLVPDTAIQDEIRLGRLFDVEIENVELWRPLAAITRSYARVSPTLKAFLDVLTEFGNKALAAQSAPTLTLETSDQNEPPTDTIPNRQESIAPTNSHNQIIVSENFPNGS